MLDDGAVDTTTRTGKLVMGILALIAEFETEIRRERQMGGIAKAKAEGRMGGRPKLVNEAIEGRVREVRKMGPAFARSLPRLVSQRRPSRRYLQGSIQRPEECGARLVIKVHACRPGGHPMVHHRSRQRVSYAMAMPRYIGTPLC